MSRLHRLSSRQTVAGTLAVLVAAATALAGAWLALRPDAPDKLADGLSAHYACAGIDRSSLPIPSRHAVQPGVHGDFGYAAERIERISCEYLGDVVVYYRFASSRRLAQVLAVSHSIARTRLCAFGGEAFDGTDMDRRLFSSLCADLHGRVHAPWLPPCPSPSLTAVPTAAQEREDYRRLAVEDAGDPCPRQHA